MYFPTIPLYHSISCDPRPIAEESINVVNSIDLEQEASIFLGPHHDSLTEILSPLLLVNKGNSFNFDGNEAMASLDFGTRTTAAQRANKAAAPTMAARVNDLGAGVISGSASGIVDCFMAPRSLCGG